MLCVVFLMFSIIECVSVSDLCSVAVERSLAFTPGSAPDPMLSNEYRRTLPLHCLEQIAKLLHFFSCFFLLSIDLKQLNCML